MMRSEMKFTGNVWGTWAFLVEIGRDGAIDQRRVGDFFDHEAGGEVEGPVAEGDVHGEGWEGESEGEEKAVA